MKPGIRTMAVGTALFILGAFIIPMLVLLSLFLNRSNDLQFIVPGTVETTVEKPGRYYLWNDFRTIYEGRSYDRSELLEDGWKMEFKDERGQPLKFVSDSAIFSSEGSSSKKSIGYVEVAQPGKVEIAVKGNGDERVFSFSQNGILAAFGLILGSFAVAMLAGLSGFALLVWGLIQFLKPKSASPTP